MTYYGVIDELKLKKLGRCSEEHPIKIYFFSTAAVNFAVASDAFSV